MKAFVEFFLLLAGAYLALGLLFAFAFQLVGLSKLDAGSRSAGVGFRLLITPGIVALWPLLASVVVANPARADVSGFSRGALSTPVTASVAPSGVEGIGSGDPTDTRSRPVVATGRSCSSNGQRQLFVYFSDNWKCPLGTPPIGYRRRATPPRVVERRRASRRRELRSGTTRGGRRAECARISPSDVPWPGSHARSRCRIPE